MCTIPRQLRNYKRHLLNRVTCTPLITEYIENCLTDGDEAANFSLHKILVHNWSDNLDQALDTISEYYTTTFVPVNACNQGDIIFFYTSNLHLVMKIIRFDFIFPFSRNMFNIDILFNDKSAFELFGANTTVEDIVSNVINNRFSDDGVLDLSNFSNDKEFLEKKIHFYKVSLLKQFKILMIRIGKDTKVLNLSNNELSRPPLDILNFFIKGDLIAINLSYNNIPSTSELLRVSSKIERLWLEGNPLCEDIDAIRYVKHIILKFPRLAELDGVKVRCFGIMSPFYKSFLVTSDMKTKMIVEQFLMLYFSHYDVPNRIDRRKLEFFYDFSATLTVNTQSQMRNINPLALIDPENDDIEAITQVFSHITKLKKPEALLRLRAERWNINEALITLMKDVKNNAVTHDKFAEEDALSDISSSIEEID